MVNIVNKIRPRIIGFDIKARIIYKPIHEHERDDVELHIIVHEGILQNREYKFHLAPSRYGAETQGEFNRMLKDLVEHKLTKSY